ncbi:MAG: flavodoxin family protein [Candidatus Hydrogenedentes bacterium]|nr:flavodoxin family protein [Candidatus Hydrogenedentota bacterium]
MMKAVALCGSPREGGNTEILLKKCLSVLEGEGISGQVIRLAEKKIAPCTACGKCFKNRDAKCIIDDDFDSVFAEMLAADIIVAGSPVYFGSATPEIMALLHRAGYVARANGNLLSRKLGGPIVVARRAGQNFTFAQLMYWFMINDMVVPGSTYWNVAIGAGIGEVNDDAEGIQTITRFAENLAWLAKSLRG